MKEFKRKFCPNCGSDNIKWALPQNWSLWECYSCGYTGAVVIEDEELANEIREKYRKKKNNGFVKINIFKE